MKKDIDEIAKAHGTETIVTSFTPKSIEDYFRTTTRFGLGWDSAWVYAIVKTSGGQRYAFCRGYEKASSNLFYSCKLLGDTRSVSPRLHKRLYIGPGTFEKIPDKEMARVQSYPSKHNFQIDLEVNRFHWQEENGEVDLHFEALGPACRFLGPGARIKEDVFYTSELSTVSGTVLGETVTGFGGIDQSWLPHGIAWAQSKTHLYFESNWFVWANRYADGSTDYGVAGCGPGNWSLAFYVKDGQPYITNDVEFQAKYAEEGYPREVDCRMGSKRFKWTCDCRMNEIKGFILWVSGRMINREEEELPIETFSQFEFRPHGAFG